MRCGGFHATCFKLGNPSNAVAPRCSKWRDTEKEIKRERSPFEVRIDGRSLLKFKLQLLCRIHLV
ncbi:MAG: hypothetical protein V7L04_25630 [Nostoc sp.]|uniref:hypothetical protein n=1 Tax=Nostoc sp. TaxID=1180 RepID=UPI002FFB8672